MTTTDRDLSLPADFDGPETTTPCARVADIDGIPMSALLSEAPNPRAVILALHGGATNSAYYDCPGHPELSLLRFASALGYTVLALDRPGYGTSAPFAAEIAPHERRVDLTYAAIDHHLGSRPRGAGLFVWAHSAGSELAVRMAADERGTDLLGIELAGTGREHQPVAAEILGTPHQPAPQEAVRELLWQPSRLYPTELIGGAPIASSTPRYESGVLATWARIDFPALAARIRVPVHFTAAEFEKVWRIDSAALQDIAAMFTAAPSVTVNEQAGSGHNLSLGHGAPDYYAKVLSFVEHCTHSTTGKDD